MNVPGGFGSPLHLAGRFFGALSPAPPPPADEAWARTQLLPGEAELWSRMSGPDRRHAIGVARETVALLDDGGVAPGREVVATALLHDVGKVESGLGTFARVFVTLAAMGAGRDRLVRPATGKVRTKTREYLTHDKIGGDLLRAAGSDPLTVSWAEEHHLPPARWTVDRRLADALKAADGD